MQRIDLREYKGELRRGIKQWRASLKEDYKSALDAEIERRLLATYQYRNCTTVLIYASTAIEVNTFGIIERALRDGKRVALPRCVKGTRDMVFRYITDVSQLERGSFGVLEPSEDLPEWNRSSGALAVVPALSLDSFGYRLGYGGGYYDRFLSKFKGETIGITYSRNYRYRLNHGRYDVPLGAVLTEKFVRKIKPVGGRKSNERQRKKSEQKSG